MKEKYELKLKTESGRTVIIPLGHFKSMQEAVTESLTIKDNVANSQSFTVQIYQPKVPRVRKKIGAQG